MAPVIILADEKRTEEPIYFPLIKPISFRLPPFISVPTGKLVEKYKTPSTFWKWTTTPDEVYLAISYDSGLLLYPAFSKNRSAGRLELFNKVPESWKASCMVCTINVDERKVIFSDLLCSNGKDIRDTSYRKSRFPDLNRMIQLYKAHSRDELSLKVLPHTPLDNWEEAKKAFLLTDSGKFVIYRV